MTAFGKDVMLLVSKYIASRSLLSPDQIEKAVDYGRNKSTLGTTKEQFVELMKFE